MKNLIHISTAVVIWTMLFTIPVAAQLALSHQLDARFLTDGLIMVGANSSDSRIGPYFGGTVAYGLGNGVALYVESGYGWTNFQSDNRLRLTQIPIIGGMSYNFGELLSSSTFQPYAGIGGGLFNYMLQRDGSTVSVNDVDQRTSNFGAEGIAGVHVTLTDYNIGLDVRAKYNHVFSDRNGIELESQDWNALGFGFGLSYHLGL